MPTYAKLKECSCLGCHKTTDKRFCNDHKHMLKASRKGADYRPYKTAQWLKLRKVVLSKQPICAGWKKSCSDNARHVDHIIKHSVYNGSFYDVKNLQGLCHSCHSRKTLEGK